MTYDPKRPAKATFAEFVRTAAVADCALSLVHTTDFFRLEKIQELGVLEPSKDPNFGDQVVCLFYGRPSYRVHPNVSNTNVSSFAPICFVLKKEFDWRGKRMHPFDTGAFAGHFLDRFVHPDLKLRDFEMDPTPDDARHLVGVFYGSNANYMDCRPNETLNSSKLSAARMHTVESYNQIIRDTRNDRSDERVHTVEVQTDRQIVLAGNVRAIVVPARLFDEKQKNDMAVSWGCEVVCYNMKMVFTPKDMMDLIFDKVRTVLVQDGQIS